MIIKIQQSITTTEKKPQMLIYNKSRDYFYEADLTEDVKEILKGRPKAYFKAEVVDTKFKIHEEVKTQNW